jgi:hypothetical protein
LKPVDLLLLIGELEGSSAHCRKLNFLEDAAALDEMKRKYYKMYFRLVKEQKNKGN